MSTSHHASFSAPPVSRFYSALYRLLRPLARLPLGGRLLRRLGDLPGPGGVAFTAGPCRLVIDRRHSCHRDMPLGAYEPENVRLLRRALRPGDCYVDVGAEIGYMAAQAAQAVGPDGRLLLFEPDPRIFPRLAAHMRSAPDALAPRIDLIDRPCSDAERDFQLELAPLSGQSQLVQWQRSEPGRPTAPVRSVVGDEVLERLGIHRIRVLKMDVEGHEIAALRGLARAFQQKRIDYFFVEKNNFLLPRNGYEAAHLCAFPLHCGYVGMREDGGPLTRERLEDRNRYWLDNLVFARDADLLREIAPQARPDTDHGLDVERLWRELTDPDYPGIEIQGLIDRVRRGDLQGGIAEGLALLERRPELGHFRGHVAHWLLAAGRKDEAREQYRRLADENPGNRELQEILAQLHTDG